MTILIFLLLVILVLIFIGIYFVRFALLRNDEFDPTVIPESEKKLTPEIERRKEIIKENSLFFDDFTEKFLQRSPHEIWEITTDDKLKLIAEFHAGNSHMYAILVHGYKGDRTQMRNLAAVYSSWGFNTLLPDNRAHGESEGKWIGMGWLDKDDIILWIKKILEVDREAKITVHGISMGGGAVMMLSGQNLPENVKALVEDCGYTSVWDIFSDELKAIYHLPSFPILNLFSFFSKPFAGYTPQQASSVEMLKKSAIPMLFIHGGDDHFVGSYMLDINYNAKNGKKEKLLIPDAGHAESYLREPTVYFSTLKAFLMKFMKI